MEPHFDIEIAVARLVVVLELVAGPADVSAGATDIISARSAADGAGWSWIADRQRSVGTGKEQDSGIGGDGVWRRGAIPEVINDQNVITARNHGCGGQSDGGVVRSEIGLKSGGAIRENVISDIGCAGEFQRFGKHKLDIGRAQINRLHHCRGCQIRKDRQDGWSAGHRAGHIGDNASIELAIIDVRIGVVQDVSGVGGIGNQAGAVQVPLVSQWSPIGRQYHELSAASVWSHCIRRLQVNARRSIEAVTGNQVRAG